jgi:hypothetical protein
VKKTEENMKKHIIVSKQKIIELLNCFADRTEFVEFCTNLTILADQIVQSHNQALELAETDENGLLIASKIVATFAMFCRENMELVQQLAKHVEYYVVNDEELSKALEMSKNQEWKEWLRQLES